MDEQDFSRWRGGDPDAYWSAWSHLWAKLYTWLVWFCTLLAGDRATGEIWADAVWEATLAEIGDTMRRGRVRWMGRREFERYVRRRLRWRVLDRARAARRAARASVRPPGRRVLAARRFLDAVRCGVGTTDDVLANPYVLLRLRTATAQQPALLAVVDQALRYLHDRFADALPPGDKPGMRTWPELAAAALPERWRVDKRARSVFIMRALGIARNAFDLRVRRLRVLAGITRQRRRPASRQEEGTSTDAA